MLIPRQSGLDVPFSMVSWYLVGMAVASLLAWILGWARSFVMARVGERISADLRDQTYGHLLRLSMEFFGGKRTGDLMSRISSDTDRICQFLSVSLVDFATDVLMILGTAIILIVKAPMLAAATLCPMPIVAWLVHRARRKLRHGFGESYRAWAEITSVLADTIPGIRVVKAFAQESREESRFAAANAHNVRVNDKVNAVWAFFGPTLGLVTQLGLLVVWVVGAYLVFHQNFKVGVLTMFLTYLARFYTRLESMSRMVQSTQRAAASASRVFEILDRVPERRRPGPLQLRPIRSSAALELRDVGFRYANRTVLDGVTLKVRRGEMVGVVGPSGAGKSTLVNLICRFYDVTVGLDPGRRHRHPRLRRQRLPPPRRHRAPGAVPLLRHDRREHRLWPPRGDAGRRSSPRLERRGPTNSSSGCPTATTRSSASAARRSRAASAQRVSIARALLIDPKILILDEATSSVDTETEREIQEALDNLIRGRTTIAIAHRLSTLRKADRIVVLERGRITEMGQHEELLQSSGTYARLHRVQAELAGVAE